MQNIGQFSNDFCLLLAIIADSILGTLYFQSNLKSETSQFFSFASLLNTKNQNKFKYVQYKIGLNCALKKYHGLRLRKRYVCVLSVKINVCQNHLIFRVFFTERAHKESQRGKKLEQWHIKTECVWKIKVTSEIVWFKCLS